MSADTITQLIIEYRYWILLPLTFLEGPVVAFVAGTLASAGYFNVYFLAVLFFVRDVGLDAVYYALGYFGGKTAFAKQMLQKIGVTEDHLAEVGGLWKRHPGKTLFIGKLSYGIASAFIVVAGMVKMPLRTFFFYASIVAITQYGTLLLLGYFFGTAFGNKIETLLQNIQYVALGIGILFTLYYLFSWRMRRKFLQEGRRAKK